MQVSDDRFQAESGWNDLEAVIRNLHEITSAGSGGVRKISPLQGFDPRTFQPVTSRYTDWDIATHSKHVEDIKN